MADVTITGLTNASLPLDGSERVPMDKGGATVDATTADVAATVANSVVIGKVLTGYVSGAGTVAATDTILQAIQKLNGNDHASVTLTASLTDVLSLTGQALAGVDAGADRILFWDDSESKLSHLTLGTNLSITGTTINATGSGSGISDGDKGDITVSDTGATWTIDNGSVTLAKQANVATATVFYRKTGGTGAPEVQTLATLKTDLGLTGTNTGDQTISNSSDATSHTVTLSASGGTVQFVEGANITLTTTGTASAAVVTIAGTGGGGLSTTGGLSDLTDPRLGFANLLFGGTGVPALLVSQIGYGVGSGSYGTAAGQTSGFSLPPAGELSTGTTAAGRGAIFLSSSSNGFGSGGGKYTINSISRFYGSFLVRIPTLSTGGEAFDAFIGLYDETNGYSLRNTFGAKITGSTIAAVSTSAGVETVSSSTDTIIANTYTKIEVIYDGTTLSVIVNDGTARTVSTGFPGASSIMAGSIVNAKTAGTTARLVQYAACPVMAVWTTLP